MTWMGNITKTHCKEATRENMDWVWVALFASTCEHSDKVRKLEFHKRKGIYSITERVSDQKLCSLLLATYATVGSRLLDWMDVQGIYSQHKRVYTCFGNHPAFWLIGIAVSSTRMKWPCREPDLWPPPCMDIKNAWSYNSTPPYDITSWCDTFSSCTFRDLFSHCTSNIPQLFTVQRLLPASRSYTQPRARTHAHQALST